MCRHRHPNIVEAVWKIKTKSTKIKSRWTKKKTILYLTVTYALRVQSSQYSPGVDIYSVGVVCLGGFNCAEIAKRAQCVNPPSLKISSSQSMGVARTKRIPGLLLNKFQAGHQDRGQKLCHHLIPDMDSIQHRPLLHILAISHFPVILPSFRPYWACNSKLSLIQKDLKNWMLSNPSKHTFPDFFSSWVFWWWFALSCSIDVNLEKKRSAVFPYQFNWTLIPKWCKSSPHTRTFFGHSISNPQHSSICPICFVGLICSWSAPDLLLFWSTSFAFMFILPLPFCWKKTGQLDKYLTNRFWGMIFFGKTSCLSRGMRFFPYPHFNKFA